MLVIVGTILSCAKSIDLNLDQSKDQVLIIDGQLTDLNKNNYVRLSWARKVTDQSVVTADSAIVVISNQKGEVDTLVNEREIETYADDTTNFNGYYYTTTLKCKAGDTYHLTVKLGGNVYEADAYMPPVARLDSVALLRVDGRPVHGFSYLPLIYFHDPRPARNFYMFNFCDQTNDTGMEIKRYPCKFTDRIWNVAILDDRLLPEYVKGLNVTVGVTPNPDFNSWWLSPGYYYTAYLYSFTEEAYAYYQALVKSLASDGGVFSPAPANAPSNIRGTAPATGFFNASSVSSYRVYTQP